MGAVTVRARDFDPANAWDSQTAMADETVDASRSQHYGPAGVAGDAPGQKHSGSTSAEDADVPSTGNTPSGGSSNGIASSGNTPSGGSSNGVAPRGISSSGIPSSGNSGSGHSFDAAGSVSENSASHSGSGRIFEPGKGSSPELDRGEEASSLILNSGPFKLSVPERKLWKDGQEIVLTPTEWTLVRLLMERQGTSVSRDQILNDVWGRYYVGDLKVVDVNIRRIRQKIESNPSNPSVIETVWGFGYRWKRSIQS
ncbi:winged helix-turn-helix domain-containing protein [Paenibacillus sp. CAU 1782]